MRAMIADDLDTFDAQQLPDAVHAERAEVLSFNPAMCPLDNLAVTGRQASPRLANQTAEFGAPALQNSKARIKIP